jgi:hypothetical protein
MANTKISALTSATTPLAGTEVLPIVQSSATVKVATNDLTVRNIRANATTGILQVTGPTAASTRVMTVPDANFTAARTDAAQSFTGDQTLSTGNLIIGTSGKGVDFSATPGTGTSELFADYEEGTWTPTFTAEAGSFGVISYATRTGFYTKIGNMCYFSCNVFTNSLAIGTATGNVTLTGLPFSCDSTSQYSPPPALGRIYRWASALTNMRCFVQGTSISFPVMATNSASGTNAQVSDLTTGSNSFYNCIDISGCYKVA